MPVNNAGVVKKRRLREISKIIKFFGSSCELSKAVLLDYCLQISAGLVEWLYHVPGNAGNCIYSMSRWLDR